MAYKSAITEAPYDKDGNLLHYPDPAAEMRKIEPFIATLTLNDQRRGRSARYVLWEDKDGRQYPMFISEFVRLVKTTSKLRQGRIRAVWVAHKRGENYGIKHVRDTTTS